MKHNTVCTRIILYDYFNIVSTSTMSYFIVIFCFADLISFPSICQSCPRKSILATFSTPFSPETSYARLVALRQNPKFKISLSLAAAGI